MAGNLGASFNTHMESGGDGHLRPRGYRQLAIRDPQEVPLLTTHSVDNRVNEGLSSTAVPSAAFAVTTVHDPIGSAFVRILPPPPNSDLPSRYRLQMKNYSFPERATNHTDLISSDYQGEHFLDAFVSSYEPSWYRGALSDYDKTMPTRIANSETWLAPSVYVTPHTAMSHADENYPSPPMLHKSPGIEIESERESVPSYILIPPL